MSKIILKKSDANVVPTPPTGKITIFLDADNITKVKKDDGNVIPLEGGVGGVVDAENVTYNTNDVIWWDWTTLPLNVEDALDKLANQTRINLNHISLLIPPEPPSLSLIEIVSPSTYLGILPSGLSPTWYTKVPAGTNISNLIYLNNIVIESPDFFAGAANDPPTFGIIYGNIDGVDEDFYDMTSGIDGTGANNIISAFNIGNANPFWNKSQGRLSNTGYSEGLTTYQIRHSDSGNSDLLDAYYDDNLTLPSFVSPILVILNPIDEVIKHVSGIQYLTIGTKFLVSYDVDDAFNKVYSVSGVTKISCPGFTGMDVDPQTIPAYNDQFSVNNAEVILNDAGICDLNPILQVTVTKPNNNAAAVDSFNINSNFNKSINTFGIISTGITELFHDEDRRLISGTMTSFDSTISLPNGEAQVRCGQLVYGDIDYPLKTGDQYYERIIESGILNGGIIDFGNLIDGDISPYGTGDLNLLLWLETQDLYFDISKFFGDINGTGTGDSPTNSIGAKVQVQGSEFSFTFGTNSTSLNNDRFKIIAILKNNNKSIEKIELV